MSETTPSLNEQLSDAQENLRLIQERKAQYVLETDIPLQIVKDERRLETQITDLQARLERQVQAPCPYRGLLAFREQDAPFFFGRATFTERLVEAVQGQTPVIVVVGSSGSGKSSVVFAGLLPRLSRASAPHSQGENWAVAHFRPGDRPFDELANVLIPLLEPQMTKTDRMIEVSKLAGALRWGELALSRVVAGILEESRQARRLLLVVDQFEELYTLCLEPEVRRCFLDVLLEASGLAPTFQADVPRADQISRPECGLTLLLTLRADFLGQALAYRPFAEAIDHAQKIMLGPMTRDELEAAITRPAEQQGVAIETGLVARILDDVGSEPGILPLLEFALTQLWERQESGELTHKAYQAIGKVQGSLTHHADQVYGGLGKAEQKQARRIFVQLVCPGEGTEDTRRRASRAELGDTDWTLVQHLADTRLVVTTQNPTEDEVVEVAHEALIRGWGRLRTWMEEDRDFRTWQERLRAALHQWEVSGRDEGALLRGVSLVQAERWLAERPDGLNSNERGYVQRGVVLRKQELASWKRERVLFTVAGGLLGGALGGLIGGIISHFIRSGLDKGMVITGLSSSLFGALFGGGIAFGIGFGLALSERGRILPIIGGVVAGMLLGMPLGPFFGLALNPEAHVGFLMSLGVLLGAVYGGGIALSVAIGKRWGERKRISIPALMGTLVGGLVGVSFEGVTFSAFVGLGIALGIGIIDARFEKVAVQRIRRTWTGNHSLLA